MRTIVVALVAFVSWGVAADTRPRVPRSSLLVRRDSSVSTAVDALVVATSADRQPLLVAAAAAATRPASRLSPTTARLLLLLAGAIYGTYPVLLRAVKAVGGEPLPTVFVSFVRYQFLTACAMLVRGIRAAQKPAAKDGGARGGGGSAVDDGGGRKLWLAATELAAYTVVTSLLSIAGLSLVSAVTSEILTSTMHVFVPLQTLWLLGRADFGARTWAGCVLAFGAAVLTAVVDGGAGGGGSVRGQLAIVCSAFVFGIGRVRTQVHLRAHASEALNTARMVAMGALSVVPLLVDLALGGETRRTLTRLHRVLPAQWLLMFASVFLSAFVASSLQFLALEVIPAANAQPFAALQPAFAALWSTLFLAEPISAGTLGGGALMLLSTWAACTDKVKSGKGE